MDIIWYFGLAHLLLDGALATVALYYCAYCYIKEHFEPRPVVIPATSGLILPTTAPKERFTDAFQHSN